MSKLVIMRGLPGSGKSTLAKEWVAEDSARRIRVSRDDLRAMLFGRAHGLTHEQEKLVTSAETAAVRAGLDAGLSVVVDAMHLAARYVRRWEALGAPVELCEMPTPIEECIDRDSMRDRPLGESVIRAIAKRYQIPADGTLPRYDVGYMKAKEAAAFAPAPPHDPELPDALIVDIDGTLADIGERSPYAKDAALYAEDGVFEDVASLVATLSDRYYIICVSGRFEEFRAVTQSWLNAKARVNPDALFMRANGDERKDDVVKSEIFDREIAGKYNVVGVLDDRGRVLRMWRAKGLTTLAVGDTDNNNF